MPAVSSRPHAVPRFRPWGVAVATLSLITAPLLVAVPAHAAEPDLVGTVLDGGSAWPDGTLAAFLEDETYNDSLWAPFEYDDRDTGEGYEISGALPDGISVELHDGDLDHLYFTGMPTDSDPFDFTVTWNGTEGERAKIRFTGTVASTKLESATTLTVTSPVTTYNSIRLDAAVTNVGGPGTTPTGTVEFWTDPVTWGSSTLVGSATLSPTWTATFTWTAMSAADVGDSRGFIAKYLGDAAYAASTSSVATTLPYIPAATGVVKLNGGTLTGATVRLLDAGDPSIVVDTDGTDATGTFILNPGAPVTEADARTEFIVEATLAGGVVLYYNDAGTPNVTDIADADAVSRLTWTSPLAIDNSVPPTWTDSALGAMRAGTAYTDSVAAASPTLVTYSVTAGSLPDGLGLQAMTGIVTGTPLCALEPCSYSFTITATNAAGSITQAFAGTLLPAGVPPTWTDDVLADDLQVTVPVTDGVTAAGDPTIVYSSSGTLPPGLTLSPTTGALTGTPTTAGDYTFRITATNDYGSVDADFVRTVAAAPTIDLQLNFAAGTDIDDATTQISADGLKVGSSYTLTMFSTPVVLYTGIIGPTGGFTWTVSLPANTPPGAHSLVLSGIAPNGSTMTAQAWFILLPNGKIGAISYTGPLSMLAFTGSDPIPPLGLAGVLLALGAGALIVRRRMA